MSSFSLCAFGKTPILQPGEKCTMQLTFPISQMASFSENVGGYLLEKGDYLIALGNSSASNTVVAKIILDKTVNLLSVDKICPLARPLKELDPLNVPQRKFEKVTEILLNADEIKCLKAKYRGVIPDEGQWGN